MNETKKGLRIAAGILLLIPACFSILSAVTSFVSMRENLDVVAFSLCWSAVTAVLGILIAVFVLARKFTVSAVLECLLLVVPFVMSVVYTARQGGGFSFDALRRYWTSLSLSSAIQLADTGAAILLIIGLFLHNRKAKPLLIIGAVLSLLASLGQLGYTLTNYIGNAGNAGMYRAMGITVGVTVVPALITFTAWILLAVYFGAQKKAAA